MPDYSKAKIYKIVGGGLTYYGSTVLPLSQRLAKHNSDKKYFDNGTSTRKYTSFEVLSKEDCDICLVENFPCSSKEELHQRERYFIENNDCVNKHIPTRSKAEYKEVNKEYFKEQSKVYRQNNKQAIAERDKAYTQRNQEKVAIRKREYREANREALRKSAREYYYRKKAEKQQ